MFAYLKSYTSNRELKITDAQLEQMVTSPPHRRDVALLTYCHWLILRMAGDCDGPAVLALWRIVSRSSKGGIRRGFSLSVNEYQQADVRVLAQLRIIADNVT